MDIVPFTFKNPVNGYPMVPKPVVEARREYATAADFEKWDPKTLFNLALKQNYLLFYNHMTGYSLASPQREWHDIVMNQSKAVTMAPRGQGKSEFWSVMLPIWIAYQDGDILRKWVPDKGIRPEIYIFSESRDLASDILLKISDKIDSDPRLQFLNPIEGYDMEVDFFKSKKTWSKTEIITSTGVRIKSKAFLSRTRGGHPPVIIMDDVLSEFNSLTPESRKKTLDYFNEAIYNMLPKPNPQYPGSGGRLFIVGTAQHPNDLYHTKGAVESFHFLKQSAYSEKWNDSGVEYICLDPARFPFDYLMQIKAEIGEFAFQKEYMNNPMADELSLFPATLIESCFDEGLSYVDSYDGSDAVYLGGDFSVPGEQNQEQGDYTVIGAARKDSDGRLILLNYYRNRGVSYQQQCAALRRYCDLYTVDYGLVEANMFQRIYAEEFRDSDYPIEGNVVTHTGKNSIKTGVPAMRTKFEHRRIVLPYRTALDKEKTNLIMRELNGVIMRKGKIGNMYFHDDIVMMLFHLIAASEEENRFEWMIS